MNLLLLLSWQAQLIIITYIILILLVVAIDDNAGDNLIRFFTGIKKLVAVKPIAIISWLAKKLKDFLGIK